MDARLTGEELDDICCSCRRVADAQLRKALWWICEWIYQHEPDGAGLGCDIASELHNLEIMPWPESEPGS